MKQPQLHPQQYQSTSELTSTERMNLPPGLQISVALAALVVPDLAGHHMHAG
jgi:uncharacterized lipoprotein YbaY